MAQRRDPRDPPAGTEAQVAMSEERVYKCALSFSPSFGWPPPRSSETISHGAAGPLMSSDSPTPPQHSAAPYAVWELLPLCPPCSLARCLYSSPGLGAPRPGTLSSLFSLHGHTTLMEQGKETYECLENN